MEDFRRILYKKFQEDNPNKFNEELIYYKRNEDILKFANSIGKGLEILKGIEFKDSYKKNPRKVYQSSNKAQEINIEKNYVDEIVMQFKIYVGNKKDNTYEEKDINLEFYFPRLIDDQFFILNGVTYTPIYQLIDSGTYRTKDSLVSRNQVMPVKLEQTTCTLTDTEENEYTSNIFILNMFKSKVNMFVYYFSKMGVNEALEYFNLNDYMCLVDLNEYDFNEETINFKLSNNFGISIAPEVLEDETLKTLIFTVIKNFNNRSKYEAIIEQDYWIKLLGSNFTKNNSVFLEKGLNILISFERCLDSISQMILRWDEKDKENIYAIVRFMSLKYKELSKLDNMNLGNKRLRLYEHLIYPLQNKLSNGAYRLLNKKSPTLDEIKSIFKIPKTYLISTLMKTKTIRYVGGVNSYDLFSVALKATLNGPQSPFSSKKSDNIRLRAIHPSYVGRIDLLSTSAGDPGVSFELVPFLKLEKDLHFTKEFNLSLEEEKITGERANELEEEDIEFDKEMDD